MTDKKMKEAKVDLLVVSEGRKINLELNSSYNESTKKRNINFYFYFSSQKTLVSEA